MEMILGVVLFALVSTITPGPNNIMIMTSGVNFGVRRTLPHYLGICLGFPLMVAAIGLGLGQIFEVFPQLHELIKWLGTGYLLFLAYKIAGARALDGQAVDAQPINFTQAVLFQWVNPKAWVMAIGAMAVYSATGAGMAQQAVLISLVFLVMAFPCVGSWMVLGASLQRFLQQEHRLRMFNFVMAGLLVLSLYPMLISEF